VTERSLTADTTRTKPLVTALRVATLLAVLAILWQGATAGGILMHASRSLALHEAGAIAVHVLTAATALAAIAFWRTAHGSPRFAVLAVVVFVASFVQASLGDDETMWAHVPGALLLMLGSAALLVWAWLPKPVHRR
jgi:hypothetical protein